MIFQMDRQKPNPGEGWLVREAFFPGIIQGSRVFIGTRQSSRAKRILNGFQEC